VQIEADPRRAAMLQTNLDRLRLGRAGSTASTAFELWVGDGCAYGVGDDEGLGDLLGAFDGVLLDAPCSATGTGRRRPDVLRKQLPPPPPPAPRSCSLAAGGSTRAEQRNAAKLHLRNRGKAEVAADAATAAAADDWYGLLRLQRKLAEQCARRLLKPGGVLVYSTCSLLREEGEDQAARLLSLTAAASGPDATAAAAAAAGSVTGDAGGARAAGPPPVQRLLRPLPFEAWEVPGFEGAVTVEGWLRVLPGCLEGPFASADGFFVARFEKPLPESDFA
jgi:16S rRNA C967 or C1407 C5-methylase (RsmB/RsmF family)